jgi:hypothetical protein
MPKTFMFLSAETDYKNIMRKRKTSFKLEGSKSKTSGNTFPIRNVY